MMIAVHVGTQNVEIEVEADMLLDSFCQRIEDLSHEKLAVLDEYDATVAENIALRNELAEAKKQLFTMRGA